MPLTSDEAREVLRSLDIPFGADFHVLRSDCVEALLDEAKARGYRKPANANGSRGRYFHAYLQRKAAQRETQ
jgi:hypothetical protein